MKKELKESLRHIQSHPTTGTAHNQQLISTQVETVFAIDKLTKGVKKLAKTVKDSNEQSQRLERSNYNLQKAMFILTALSTIAVLYPLSKQIYSSKFFEGIIKFSPTSEAVSIIAALTALLGGIVAFFTTEKVTTNYKLQFKDKIKIRDRFHTVLKDKDGKIKEKRSG